MKLTEKLLKEQIGKVMNEAEPRAKFRNYDTSGVKAVEDYKSERDRRHKMLRMQKLPIKCVLIQPLVDSKIAIG